MSIVLVTKIMEVDINFVELVGASMYFVTTIMYPHIEFNSTYQYLPFVPHNLKTRILNSARECRNWISDMIDVTIPSFMGDFSTSQYSTVQAKKN